MLIFPLDKPGQDMRRYRYLQKDNHQVSYDWMLLSIGCLKVCHVKVAPQGSHSPEQQELSKVLYGLFRLSGLKQVFVTSVTREQ
jgi:hypothetical protein